MCTLIYNEMGKFNLPNYFISFYYAKLNTKYKECGHQSFDFIMLLLAQSISVGVTVEHIN